MNQNRSLRYLVALIAVAGLFVGNSIGVVLDQAAAVTIDPALWLAFQACDYCVENGLPVLSNLVAANRWTIIGSLGGLGVGLLVGLVIRWFLRPRAAGPIRRLSGFRQASELARFSQALTDTLDPHRILVQLHTEVLHVTGADCGSSFLLDPTSPEHRVAMRVGEGVELQRLNPMEAEAVVSGRSRSVQDFEADGEPPPHVGIRSALLVPITHEENAIGLIHLHSQQPATFDAEFVDYVQVLAAQAAVAIRNAQRYEEQSRRSEGLRQRVNQLQQLTQIPNTVRVDRPLAANLESIAQTMQDTAGFGFVLISVYQPAGNHLALATASGLAAPAVERLQQQPVPWERLQPFLREEFRSNRVFLVPHTQTAAVYTALDLDQPHAVRPAHVAGQWHPDDLLLVPLYNARGEIQGLISLSAPRDPETPQALVLEMLEVFASQTTLAIENAQALTQAEERLTEAQGRAVQLGALTEVSGAMVGTLRAAEVIPVALDQLRRLIPYDSATFWKRDLNDNRWQLSGARSSHEDPERVVQRAERSQPTLFTEISATRGVVFVPDVTRDVRFSFKEASTMRSWLGVPVLSQGEVVGVLVLEKAEDNFYGAAHAPLALAFASRLAVALDNARLYEESVGHAQELEEENTRRAVEGERRAQRLTLLNRIAGELAEARDQAAVLTSTLHVLREALGADYAAGLLFETEVPHEVPYVVAQARLPQGAGSALPLTDNPLLERLAAADAPLLVEVERAPLDAALLRPESLAWVGPALGAALFVPLAAEGRLAGLLGLGQTVGRRFWPADLDLAWAVGQQAGMALQNLRLRERTQEQAIANQLVRALSRAADRPELYATLREQLSSVAALPHFTLALYDAERNHVTIPVIVEGAAGQTADLAPRPPVGLLRHLLLNRQPVRLAGDLTVEAQAQGLALTTGQPLLREGAAPAAAYLGVPLLLGERVLGALVAHQADPAAAFTDRQERLLAAAAGQTAVALDNLTLYEQARQGLAVSQARTTELEALAEATVALAATLRVADLVTVALDQLQRLLPYARAVAWLRSPHARARRRNAAEWHAAAVRQMDADRLADRLTLAAGSPLGDVLSTRRVGLVADTGRDTRFGGAARAWLGLPLAGGDEVTGLIELESAAPGGFTPAHAALAQAFATRAGAALENARQYEASLERAQSLDDQARRLTQLNQAALTLGGSLDLDMQLAAAARLLTETLNADQVQLILWAADGRLTQTTALPAAADAAATPAALAAAAPLWERFRAEAAPLPVTLAELRGEQGRPAEQLAWLGPQATTGLLLPLTAAGHTLGVAAIGWAAAEHPFTVAEVEAAQSMARLSAAALAEAAQYEATQQRLSEQATANLISRAVSQAVDLPHLTELLRTQLDAWLKPEELSLALYDAARNEVSFPLAVRGGQAQVLPAEAPSPLLRQPLTTQQPLLLTGDVTAQLRDLGLPPEALGTARSFLGLPLRLNDTLLGVITLADPARADRLTESHQRVLSAVAPQVAVTVGNLQQHARTQRQLTAERDTIEQRLTGELESTQQRLGSELETTQQRLSEQATAGLISRAVSQALDVPHLAALLREQIEAWLRPGELALALYDATRHEVSYPLAVRGGQPQTLPVQPPSPLLHHLITSRQPLLLTGEAAAAQLTELGLPADALGAARSYLGLPLRLDDQVLGVLVVADPLRGEALTDSQQRVLTSVGLQVAITLENARLYSEGLARVAALDERAQRLAWLQQVNAELAGTLDVPQILSAALRQLADVLLVEQAGALLFEDAAAQLLAHTPPETAPALLAPQPLAGHPLFERVAENDRPLALDDLPAERLIRPEHTAWVGFELRSALLVPLVAQGRPVGLLGFGSTQPRVWSAAEVELAAGAAQAAALAVANGRRYAEVQQRLSEQTTLSQVLRAVSLAGDLEQLLEVLRARLPGWTGADHAYVALFDETRNEATLPLLVENGRLRTVAPFAPGGLLRHVLQTRHALRLAGEVTQQSQELGLPIHAATRRPQRWATDGDEVLAASAYLALPIMLGEKVLGVLAVEAAAPEAAFTDAQERLLGVIAAQTAIGLENSRLYAQTREALTAAQERVAQLEALTTALSNVASVLYSEEVVSVALEQFRRVLPYDHATFWQREATAGSGRDMRWRLAGTRGYPEAEARQAFGLDNTYQALFGELVVGRRPLLVADTSRDTRFGAGQPVSPRTWLGVPLVTQGDVIGILVLEKLQPNAYAPVQVAPVMILANQVTAVLTNARQFEENAARALELDERTRRLAFLNRFGAELANNLDLGSLMRLTLKAMTEAMGLEQATGAVFDETRSALLALEHYPAPAAGPRTGRAALPGNFLLERLQEAPTPITLEDVTAPEAHPRLLRQADWIGQEVGAAMFVPLVNNGSLIGLVGLGQSEAGRHFTPGEMELAQALANQAAAAVNQARLYERAQQRLAEQASVNQMSRALARAVDLRALGEQLRQQIEAWVDAESVYLAVYDEDRNEVSFPLAIAADQPVAPAPRAPSGLVRHLLQRRQPLRLNGEITQQLKDQSIFTTGLSGAVGLDDVAQFTSYLAVPLLNGERVTGAVLLGGPRRAEAFDESHERILSAVGAQLAAALDHTRQFEQTRALTAASQSRAAQLSVLTDVSSVIASGLRTEQVVALMLDQLQRVLPYDRARFWQRAPVAAGQPARWRPVAQRGTEDDLAAAPAVEITDPQTSALAELLAARTSLVVADTTHDRRFGQPGAWLGLPLLHQGEVLGLLALETTESHGYTTAQLPLAQAFAGQAAVALANVGLYEDSLHRASALDARTALLNRVSAAINSTLEPAELFQAALSALAQALDLDQAAAIVFDDSRAAGRLRPLVHYPATDVDQAGSLALTANPLLDQLRERLAPIAIEDAAHNALVTPDLTAWVAPDLRSALFLPLVVAGKLIGLLGLGHTRERRRFTPGDTELAMTVANQVAIASHNAGLYQRTHRRLVELATISQASRAISQTIDLQQLYETVRTQVEVAVKADMLYLALYDEAKDELRFPLAVEHGQAVELSPRAPDRLLRHILATRQPLLLAGEIGAKLVELGLAAEGAPLLRAKSYLGVPLVVGAQVRGVLAVEDYKRAYAYTDKHEQSLLTIAAPIAAAVDGAALYELSAQKALALNARAALLGRVSAELSETTELDTLLRFTAQMMAETLLTNIGAAIVLDEAPEAGRPLKVARYPAADDEASPIVPGHPLLAQLQARLAPLPLDEFTGDPAQHAELRAWLGPEVVSALFLPLITLDKLIGLVAVGETNAQRRFTAGELDLAMTLANQAAVAIANARLQSNVQPHLVELATITRLCRALGQAVTLPELSELLLTDLGAALKAETIYLALWDAPRNTLTFPLMFDGGQSLAARPQTPGGALRFILEQRQPLLLNGGIARQLEARGLTYQPVLAGAAAPESFLGVPLLVGSRVLGALVVEDQNQVGKFGASQEIILTTVAAPIAVAVENALLQVERTAQAREIEERAAQLAGVIRLSSALMGALAPEAILQHTLDTLQSTFGVAHAAALRPLTAERWALVRPTGEAAAPDPLPTPAALLAQVAGGGQALAVPDLAAAEHPLAGQLGWLAPAPRGLLLLPVRLGDEVVGLVALAEDTARSFDPRAVDLAVTCANQAAIALENSRLYQQARSVQVAVADQAAQYDRVAAAQQRISAAADFEAVAAAALAELPHLAPFDSATLWLREAAAPNTLRAVAAQGNQRRGQTLNLTEQAVYAEILTTGAVRVADTQADTRFRPSGEAATRSWLGVALGRGEEAAGVLVLEKAEADCYQPEHVAALQAVAAPLAVRLAQTQQQAAALTARRAAEAEANRLALLQRVTGKVAQTLDLHSVLRGLLTELVALVPADQAAALLFADSADPAASHGLIFTQYPAQNTSAPLPSPGHPLLARLQTAEGFGPAVLNDLAAEGVPPAQLGWLGVEPQSALLLPLVAGEAWLGVVGLGAGSAGAFTAERVSLAHSLTQQAGAAAQNAYAHFALRRDLQLQVALNRLAPAFAGVRALDQLAPALTAEAAALFGANTVYLALYEAAQGQVSFPVLVEAGQPRTVRPLAPQGVIAHILQSRQPLNLTGDVAAQLKALDLPAAGARARREAGDPSNAAAYLGGPVLIEAEVVGVLAVEGSAFTTEHLTLLTALAEQVALVLQRLRAEGAALAARAQVTQQYQQQLTARTTALAAWRDRYAALLAAHPPAGRPALEAALHQALRVAGQAVGADYGVLYLNDAGRLSARAAFGSDAHLPAGDPLDLAGAVLRSNEPVIIGDLLADPRWAVPASAAPTAEAAPAPNGANGHDPAAEETEAEAAPEPTPAAANGQYHSSLALPVGPNGGGPAGVLLFFSARPAAFAPEAVPVAAAAADQLAYTLDTDARLRAWHLQAAQLRDSLAADETAWADEAARVPVEPVGVETVRVVPTHREPVAALPLTVTPAMDATGDEPEPIVRPAQTPLWRRLALPVGLVSLVLCVGLAVTVGPLRGLFGAAPLATPTAATATVPAAGVDTQAAPTDTLAPATATLEPTATTTAEPTATATVEPTATATAEPTATPTEPLPADVLAAATVTLPDGIVGRLRDAPNGNVVGGVSNGTEVHVISNRQTTEDGIAWVRIRLIETGQTGWVGESLLTYTTPPPG